MIKTLAQRHRSVLAYVKAKEDQGKRVMVANLTNIAEASIRELEEMGKVELVNESGQVFINVITE
jgi:hypothetical protein